jgi:hypothetical protein
MSGSVNKGRLEPCKNTLSGVKNVYFWKWQSYNLSQITGVRGVSLTAYPSTTVFKYPTVSDANTYDENLGEDNAYDQSLTVTLKKIDLEYNQELSNYQNIILGVIVEDYNGLFRLMGAFNGVELADLNVGIGSGRADFNGYKLTLEAKERFKAPLFTSLNAVGFFVDQIPIQKLLDQFPNAAAAFSVKKIRAAYTGNCMKVRRTSDNTTLDIGFSGDDLDITALQTFCAGTDGFVDTWYNQSGNSAVATQTAFAKQPKIVTNGSVILKDGIPAVSSDGIDDFMSISNGETFFSTEFSAFSVFAYKVKSAQQRFYSYSNGAQSSGSYNLLLLRKNGSNMEFLGTTDNPLRNITVQISNSQDLVRLVTSHLGKENDNIRGKTDTSSVVNATIGNFIGISQEGYNWNLFSARNATTHAETLSQQFVFYDSDQTSNIQDIEDEIKTTFNI